MLKIATVEHLHESLYRRTLRRVAIAHAIEEFFVRIRFLELGAVNPVDLSLRLADVVMEADEEFQSERAIEDAVKEFMGDGTD